MNGVECEKKAKFMPVIGGDLKSRRQWVETQSMCVLKASPLYLLFILQNYLALNFLCEKHHISVLKGTNICSIQLITSKFVLAYEPNETFRILLFLVLNKPFNPEIYT